MKTHVIIGAGITGIYLLSRLVKKYPKVKFLILDLEDIIGGRLLSVPFNDAIVDLGAMRFYDTHTMVVGLVEELGLPTEPFDITVGKIMSSNTCNLFDDEEIDRALLSLQDVPNPTEVSLKESLYKILDVEDIDYSFERSGYDIGRADVSLRDSLDSLIVEAHSNTYRIVGGYVRLASALLETIPKDRYKLILGARVVSVSDKTVEYVRKDKVCKIDKVSKMYYTGLPLAVSNIVINKRAYTLKEQFVNRLTIKLYLKIEPYVTNGIYPTRSITPDPIRQLWQLSPTMLLAYTDYDNISYFSSWLGLFNATPFVPSDDLKQFLIKQIDPIMEEVTILEACGKYWESSVDFHRPRSILGPIKIGPLVMLGPDEGISPGWVNSGLVLVDEYLK